MINVGVICDINWTNIKIINDKFSKLNDNLHRLHTIYGKTLDVININAYNNNLTLVRHSYTSISHIIYNLLKICDIWLIFTNQIEYLNSCHLVIKYCIQNNIKYIIIQEHLFDYYSFNILDFISPINNKNTVYYHQNKNIISFSSNSFITENEKETNEENENEKETNEENENEMDEITDKLNNCNLNYKYDANNLIFKLIINKISTCKNKQYTQSFNEKLYDDNFIKKYNLTLNVPHNIRTKLQNTYTNIKEEKDQKSIKLLYDKQEIKKEKLERKTTKNIKQLAFNNNRLNYYKKS